MHLLKECRLLNTGLLDYPQGLALQKRIVHNVITGRTPHTLIACRHPHTITLSRRSRKENILASEEELKKRGVGIFCADRGGDVTYHGPGQVVLYPIFDLRETEKDLHNYLRKLEDVVINALRDNFGLNAYAKSGFTGVWVGPYKVASIGIGVRHWVTYHGLALNVKTDKNFFSLINPCGLDVKMASINDFFYDDNVSLESVQSMLIKSFQDVFGVKFFTGGLVTGDLLI